MSKTVFYISAPCEVQTNAWPKCAQEFARLCATLSFDHFSHLEGAAQAACSTNGAFSLRWP